MKIRKKIGFIVVFCIFSLAFISPSYNCSWNQDYSVYTHNPQFTTHVWLAYESLQLFSSPSQIQWITRNMLDFWHGVEAPFQKDIAENYVEDFSVYGDIDNYILYLSENGMIVTNDSLAQRAQVEYNKLVTELAKDDADLQLAAFYAGAMSHYISQAGVWGAIWDETLWGNLSDVNWVQFECQVEDSLVAVDFIDDVSEWTSTDFDLDPNTSNTLNASEATIQLAIGIHSVAEGLGDDFNYTWESINDWDSSYRNDTKTCLALSVEAIYSSILHALDTLDWKYISMPKPTFIYDNQSGHFQIPEFKVNYTDSTNSFTLTDSDAIIASFQLIAWDESEGLIPIIIPDRHNLTYNSTTKNWYYPDQLVKGTFAKTNHSIQYVFAINGSGETWSNHSEERFYVHFFEYEISSIDSYYNSDERTISIENVQIVIPEVDEIGVIDDLDTYKAQWMLYMFAFGIQTSYTEYGIPAFDTEGNLLYGNLTYDNETQTWSSYNNDIGLAKSPDNINALFVVTLFYLNDIPTGHEIISSFGFTRYIPYIYAAASNTVIPRPHVLTISQPQIDFNPEAKTLSISKVTAISDYKDTVLDFYEIYEKTIYGYNTRLAKWALMKLGHDYSLEDSLYSGNLYWDEENQYWSFDDIDVTNIDIGEYHMHCFFSTMNSNGTQSSPPSIILTLGPGAKSYVISLNIMIPFLGLFVFCKIKKIKKMPRFHRHLNLS